MYFLRALQGHYGLRIAALNGPDYSELHQVIGRFRFSALPLGRAVVFFFGLQKTGILQ
jgi:hypothetical protein